METPSFALLMNRTGKRIILFLCFALLVKRGYAQQVRLSGRLIDAEDGTPLVGASVILMQWPDTTKFKVLTTDTSGRFFFRTEPGSYKLKAELISYRTYYRSLQLDSSMRLGKIIMKTDAFMLKEAVVEAQQVRVEQKGDTTQFNANAYKVNKDATAEDLVNKMPGVTTQGGNVTVNGEQVKQVLVDGKPFFGDDPNMAMKNLPAEVIDKIQVFDKLSDQAQFTGIDDGNSQKTINIITRSGKSNGQFGKVYGGYGIDAKGIGVSDKYIAGGNVNLFKGERRISLIGLSNNINQQNFSTQDLSGMAGSTGGNGGRGGGGMGGPGGPGGGGNPANNFLVGQQGGITTTHAAGLNYSDSWGKKIKLTASYFFNDALNTNNSDLTRNYIIGRQNGLHYSQTNDANNTNLNHRANLRFEYAPDTSSTIIFTPKFSWQDYTANSALNGLNLLSGDTIQSTTSTTNRNTSRSYDVSGNILYRRKFKKPRRTFSVNMNGDYNPKNANGKLYSLNKYYQFNDSTLLDQSNVQSTTALMVSPTISYTEPVGKTGQLQINYNPSYNLNNTDKRTYDLGGFDALLNAALSNKFNNTYVYQRGGLNYRINNKKMNFMIGANAQYATLTGTESFPAALEVNKNFQSLLPQMMFNYRFSKSTNIRVMYRTNTVAPSITQLQNVINNSNPLLLSSGNADLKQDYEQTLSVRFGTANGAKARNFIVYAFANYIQNYVANSTFIPTRTDTLSGIILKPGSQLTKPVNLNGYLNARSFLTYGLPVSRIKCNLNLSSGFAYNRIPGLINDRTNLANNYNFSEGLVLSSNINEKVDFTLSYTGNYSVVKNTLQTQADNNYYYHNATARVNLMPWKGFVINVSYGQTMYAGLAQSYNQNYSLLTGALGYKFLKDQSLDVRFSVFDILKQNNSISRSVTETYIEDNHTQVLTQYYMLTLTYNLKKFKGFEEPKNENKNNEMRPPEGFQPPRRD